MQSDFDYWGNIMGRTLNMHTNVEPEGRASAEAIARDKQVAIARIIEAGAFFDEAGRAYWQADTEGAVGASERSLELLREARDLLREIPARERTLNVAHDRSEKYRAAIDLGLDKDQYDFPKMTARSAQHCSRLVASIDHLLVLSASIVDADQRNSISDAYDSALVEREWARIGKPEDKAAHFAGLPLR